MMYTLRFMFLGLLLGFLLATQYISNLSMPTILSHMKMGYRYAQ